MPQTRKIKKPLPQKKWPAFWQWKHFFKILSIKEKVLFFLFLVLFLGSAVSLSFSIYLKNTEIAAAEGGTIIEGALQSFQPRFANPIYANSDIERDLIELMFSGLMKYSENMEIIPDLARGFPEIQENGRTYKFYLRENIFWQDGVPITADDIVFTVKTIQNPDLKSPYLANWVGVEVKKINDLTVKFTLQKPYAGFLENCTLKIIPKHIWEQVPTENFALHPHNLEQAVGSGFYKMKEVKRESNGKINYITLEKNNLYFSTKPHINQIKFSFFDAKEDLIKAAKKGKINALTLSSLEDIGNNWQKNVLSLPRYFALFFNLERAEKLTKKVRLALSYATNKKELSENIVNSPILADFYGLEEPAQIYDFDIEKAKQILEEEGFEDKNEDGILEKKIKKELAFSFKSRLTTGSKGKEVEELQKCLGGRVTGYFGSETKQLVINFQEKYAEEVLEPWGYTEGTGAVGSTTRKKLNEICFGNPEETLTLEFSLVTVSQKKMIEIAQKIKEQWEKAGIQINIETYPLSQLEQDFIKPRNYDLLLFGEILRAVLDPFPFWHSSQINDPGLNLSLYQNSQADKTLEEIRKLPSSDSEERKEKLVEFQNILTQDIPAVFLYSSDYFYLTSNEIKGTLSQKVTDPSKRFSNIADWHIETKRVWK